MPIRADGLTALASRLRVYGEQGRLELSRAAIDMRRAAKPTTNRAIRAEYAVKVAPINQRIIAQSVPGEYAVKIRVPRESRRIPAQDFTTTRVTAKGVRVQLLKSSAAKIVPKSFRGKGAAKDRLVARVEKDRYPLRSIGGAFARDMLFERRGLIDEVIDTVLIRTGQSLAKRILRLRE